MVKRKEIPGLNIALLDILTGALGAVIILFVTVPKAVKDSPPVEKSRGPVSIDVKEDPKALFDQIKVREEVIKKLQVKINEMQADAQSKQKVQEEEIKKLKQKLSGENKPSYRGEGLPVDVGFEFRGKKIVFIIDVSGSMNREDRIGQVKAGLKMLITSMPADYELDVVAFPFYTRPYKPLWGTMRNLSEYNKTEIYEYLLDLLAVGYTPTSKALEYTFKTYPEATDFVVLSDGAPTKGNTKTPDNISEILLYAKNKNRKKIRINTIGVGSAFLKKKDSPAYVFLQELARDHGGFFVGF